MTARDAWLAEARRRINEKLEGAAAAREKNRARMPPPRYDEVYFRGVAWLDSLAFAPEEVAVSEQNPCTCGSGGHPRHCAKHPEGFEQHIAELNADVKADWCERCETIERRVGALVADLESDAGRFSICGSGRHEIGEYLVDDLLPRLRAVLREEE